MTPIDRPLEILIGCFDELINEIFEYCAEKAVSPRPVKVHACLESSEEIEEIARSCDIDLFLLVLNNIYFPGDQIERLPEALKIVSHLKSTYQKPVIALSGWIPNSEFPDIALGAGADKFLMVPFETKDLEEAIRFCLR